MNFLIFLSLSLLIFIAPAFAQTLVYDESNSLQYVLKFDDHVYSIPYAVNADILAMAIDPESRSLLVGLKNSQDSRFVIELKHELINAQNNDFVILADGKEIDYQITPNSDSSVFTFFIPEFTEEVEIIGTHVIPEFPFGIILIFGVMISGIVIFANAKIPFFK